MNVNPLSNITFQVVFMINRFINFTSAPVNIEFTDCKPISANVTMTKPKPYYELRQYDIQNNYVHIGQVHCSFAPCCTRLIAGPTFDLEPPFNKYTYLQPIMEYNFLKIRVPVQLQRQFYFYVYADNQYGASVVSELISVFVIFKPQMNPDYADLSLFFDGTSEGNLTSNETDAANNATEDILVSVV